MPIHPSDGVCQLETGVRAFDEVAIAVLTLTSEDPVDISPTIKRFVPYLLLPACRQYQRTNYISLKKMISSYHRHLSQHCL